MKEETYKKIGLAMMGIPQITAIGSGIVNHNVSWIVVWTFIWFIGFCLVIKFNPFK